MQSETYANSTTLQPPSSLRRRNYQPSKSSRLPRRARNSSSDRSPHGMSPTFVSHHVLTFFTDIPNSNAVYAYAKLTWRPTCFISHPDNLSLSRLHTHSPSYVHPQPSALDPQPSPSHAREHLLSFAPNAFTWGLCHCLAERP